MRPIRPIRRCGCRAGADGLCSRRVPCLAAGDTAARPVLGPWPAGDDRARRATHISGRSSRRWRRCWRHGASPGSIGRSATSRAPRHSAGSNPAPLPRSSAPRGTRWRVLVVPIAFVSEHSETLVELDVEYRHLADRLGVPGYFRVPTPNADAAFIAALAATGAQCGSVGLGMRSHAGVRICPGRYGDCPCRPEPSAALRAPVPLPVSLPVPLPAPASAP